jgi:hypothetical protein
MGAQPALAYIGKRFRSSFNFDEIAPLSDIFLPLRVNFLEKIEGFDLVQFTEMIRDEFDKRDRFCYSYKIDDNTTVLLSVSLQNSPLLKNHCFMESDLHGTLIREFEECIAFLDTGGFLPINRDSYGIGSSIPLDQLRRVFFDSSRSHLTSVSLNNSNLATSAIRSRSVRASSVENTIPSFDDHAQICSTAEGYSQEPPVGWLAEEDRRKCYSDGTISIRRYVGFQKGRISESKGYRSLEQYLQWLDHLLQFAQSNAKSIQVFSRFAAEIPVPADPSPRSILIDIEDIREDYEIKNEPGTKIELTDTCCDVTDGAFAIEANGNIIEAKVEFKPETRKYKIDCSGLTDIYSREGSESLPVSVVDYLNQNQSFRILPESQGAVYSTGQFYKPRMKVGQSFNRDHYDLKPCFITDQVLTTCSFEKGAPDSANIDGWDEDSLFGMIDTFGSGKSFDRLFGDPDIMVCDDMGKEAADFILCDTRAGSKKVVFIHAKASSATHYDCSASALHVVCSQAVKNLGYMALYSPQKPSKIRTWRCRWQDDRIGRGPVRIRRGNGTGSQVWDQIRETIDDPFTEKEVWLILGNCFSQQTFEERLSRRSPPAEALQAAYLLHATMADTASVGAQLRIFCGP